ncbi:hypothetical protein [Modestobacter sp. KNN46-3]|uniref:hypothetical protein n=1 Tax=Modestobacter sp. KNN46-3 TaxID=2711218 RepID=UPI0013E02694|nr:hypothetical protein [Modestobacter sp. KNN46-3]
MSDEDPRYTGTYLDLTGVEEGLPPERVRAVHEAVRRIEQVTILARQGVTGQQMERELRAAADALDGAVITTSPSSKGYVIDLDRVERSLNLDGRQGVRYAVDQIELAASLARKPGSMTKDIDDALQRASSTLTLTADSWSGD